MSDIIRDVLIRVGIQKANETIEPPDVKAAIDRVKEIETATTNATTTIENTAKAQAEAIAAVIDAAQQGAVDTFTKMTQAANEARAGSEQQAEDAKKYLDLLTKQAAEIEDLKKKHLELMATAEAEAKAAAERQKAQADAEREAKQALREREQAMRQMDALNQQASVAQRDVADGLMRIARAGVLLSASDEDAKALLKTLADFQVAVDIVKGVTTAYEGLNALTVISARLKDAETAATVRQTAANAALATSATAAGTAVAGAGAATAGAGVAAAAGGTALAGLAAVFTPITLVAVAAAAAIGVFVHAVRQKKEAIKEAREEVLAAIDEDVFLKGLRVLNQDAASLTLKGDRITQQDRITDLQRGLLPQGQQETALGADIQAAINRSAELERQYQERFEAARIRREFDLRDAVNLEGVNLDSLPNPEVDAAKQSLPLLEQARGQIERAISLTKEQYGIKKDILQAQQRELEIQQRQLETEQQRVDKEKERGEEVARGLGRVGKDDIEKAKIAADKLTAGQDLTDEDIAAADRLSFGGRSAALEAAAAKRRAASGIDAVRAGLGFESPEEAIKRAEEQQNQINGLLRETNEALNRTREQQVELQTATLEAVKTLSTELARLQGVINDIKDNIARNGG